MIAQNTKWMIFIAVASFCTHIKIEFSLLIIQIVWIFPQFSINIFNCLTSKLTCKHHWNNKYIVCAPKNEKKNAAAFVYGTLSIKLGFNICEINFSIGNSIRCWCPFMFVVTRSLKWNTLYSSSIIWRSVFYTAIDIVIQLVFYTTSFNIQTFDGSSKHWIGATVFSPSLQFQYLIFLQFVYATTQSSMVLCSLAINFLIHTQFGLSDIQFLWYMPFSHSFHEPNKFCASIWWAKVWSKKWSEREEEMRQQEYNVNGIHYLYIITCRFYKLAKILQIDWHMHTGTHTHTHARAH